MKTLRELGVSPVPWHVHGREEWLTGMTIPVVEDKNADAIADITTERGRDSIMANARLIAAAPVLYTSLRILLDTLDGYGYQPLLDNDPLAVVVRCGQMAIRKASGEEKGGEE